MINNKPNIFEYATKELSQDAVFMYLFDCYNSKDSKEKKVGEDFLVLLYKIQGKMIEKEIERVEIKKQYHNIDVLVLVVYKDNSTDYIIIEDKTYSSEHDNQLRRYYKDISDNIDKRTINNIYGVYFKLGMPTKSEIKALDISKDFSYKVLVASVIIGNLVCVFWNTWVELFFICLNFVLIALYTIRIFSKFIYNPRLCLFLFQKNCYIQ